MGPGSFPDLFDKNIFNQPQGLFLVAIQGNALDRHRFAHAEGYDNPGFHDSLSSNNFFPMGYPFPFPSAAGRREKSGH
jgi:hypothetical protein